MRPRSSHSTHPLDPCLAEYTVETIVRTSFNSKESSCHDLPGWKDLNGIDCSPFDASQEHANTWCGNPGVKSADGTPAKLACCACGGGFSKVPEMRGSMQLPPANSTSYVKYALGPRCEANCTAGHEIAWSEKCKWNTNNCSACQQCYCSDWNFLPEGIFPAKPDTEPDPAQECARRCTRAYGPGQKALEALLCFVSKADLCSFAVGGPGVPSCSNRGCGTTDAACGRGEALHEWDAKSSE